MTDAHMWDTATDDGGDWLPQPATALARIEGRADTPDQAITNLYTNLAETWPGWRLDSHVYVNELLGGNYEAHATATKQIDP